MKKPPYSEYIHPHVHHFAANSRSCYCGFVQHEARSGESKMTFNHYTEQHVKCEAPTNDKTEQPA